MSTQSESTKPSQGRKHSRYYSPCVRYRLPKIKEKGAIVVIASNVLIVSAFFVQIQRNYLMSATFSIAIPLISILVFATAGIVADTCVGRFKVIQTSVALQVGSSLLNVL